MKLTKQELKQIVEFSHNATPDSHKSICFSLIDNYPRIFLNILNNNKKDFIFKDYFVLDGMGVKYKLTNTHIAGIFTILNNDTSCPKIYAIKYLRDSCGFPKTETNSITLRSAKDAVEEIMKDNNIH